MERIKREWKLIKYAKGIKGNLIGMGVCLVIGIFWMIFVEGSVKKDHGLWMGGLFISVAPLYLLQIWYSLYSAKMILASPKCRAVQTRDSALLSFLFAAIGFTVLAIVRLLGYPGDPVGNGRYFLTTAVFLLCMQSYLGAVCKMFLRAYAVMYLAIIFWMIFGTKIIKFGQSRLGGGFAGNLPLIILICYLIIALGGALNYLLSRLLLKRDFDRKAFPIYVRKDMGR